MLLRKYGTVTAAGTHVRIPLIRAALTSFATSAHWTPAAGDVKVSKDSGAEANVTTLPVYTNGAWDFALSAAELTCKTLVVKVIDPAVEDQFVIVETYGNASALHPFDLGSSTPGVNVTQVSGDSTAADNLEADYDGTGYAKPASTVGTVTTVSSGFSLSAASIDAILDEPITEPAAVFAWGSATLRNVVGWLGAHASNKLTQTAGTTTLRNRADTVTIATRTTSSDGTTFTSGSAT